MAKSAYSSVLKNKNIPLTPATSKVAGREIEMAPNYDGGIGFVIDPFVMLNRFLILGSTSSRYNVDKNELTKYNADNIVACIKLDGKRVVDAIVDVSDSGTAPNNDPALFALAVAASPAYSDKQTIAYALSNLNKVARIGTHLYHFCEYVNDMRGWGRQLMREVSNWFLSKNEAQLAYQLVKYQSRDGWSARDVLRLAHTKTTNKNKNAILAWAAAGGLSGLKNKVENSTNHETQQFAKSALDFISKNPNNLIDAYEKAKQSTNKNEIVKLISDFGLTHEMIPTQFKTEAVVWDALLQKMPLNAMIRNLATMSKVGLITPLSNASVFVSNQLHNEKYIRESRLHPMALLLALGTYGSGHGVKSTAVWNPVSNVVDSLEDAFYLAFGNIVPTNKRLVYGLDVSGSMSFYFNSINITHCQIAATLAMASVRTESNYAVFGFASGLVDLKITKKDSLRAAAAKAQNANFGSTNLSALYNYCSKNKIKADAFIIITDNDINSGTQPYQVLNKYRKDFDVNSKQIVIATIPSAFSCADPKDLNSLDVSGMSADVPQLISDFIRGSNKSESAIG